MDEVELPAEGRLRVVIENVAPAVDGGRFPAKRCLGERVAVEADCLCDGHDLVFAALRYRPEGVSRWQQVPMQQVEQDRFRGEFEPDRLGTWYFSIAAWVDRFRSWQRDFARREQDDDVRIAARAGSVLIAEIAERAGREEAARLNEWAKQLSSVQDAEKLRSLGADATLVALAGRYAVPHFESVCAREYALTIERARAGYGAWYELFPRSTASSAGAHGSFKTLIERLPYVADMGFDVLYLPPIHPIGERHRKGRNNTPSAAPGEPGSPWGIGGRAGGHKAIHPELGTMDDFRRLLEAAAALGIEVALDIAFQCSPDHPYVKSHPEWFKRRPDGSIQYAENPPKRYQDIYPLDFETGEWRSLWNELAGIVEFWMDAGVHIFRVDNPHTKAFPFWQWLIERARRQNPEVIFLSEAFTRPKVMQRLAKLGFSQSYTYFTWRNTKHELTEYFTSLGQEPVRDYLRPNCWPNTPDILPEYLQHGGRPAFMVRLVLAATLAASYGIYGPAFELMEAQAREPGAEEYLDSEKYQLRHWDLQRADSLASFIRRVNRIRRENPALHSDRSLRFHEVSDDALICYSKVAPGGDNAIVVVANLDPFQARGGNVTLDLDALGLPGERTYQMHELLTGARYLWRGPLNAVRLDPHTTPAHIFRVRRQARTERDFDYFL
jgi:starch synthase (maltosyl-transferring)